MTKKARYERQDEESKKAFEAFATYRDLGITRSLREVAQKLSKSETLMKRWSSKHDWVERVAEYDAEMDRKALLQQEKNRREMTKRHANASMLFQQKVVDRLRKLKAEELTPAELIRWFETSVKIERLSRGESVDIQELKHGGEVKQKHEHDIADRLEEYADLLERSSETDTE